MAGSGPLRVAIVGCGNISKAYASTMRAHPEKIALVGAYDLDAARAEELVREFGGKAYHCLEDVLADPAVECVVNLTIHSAHVPVITQCLQAGKHVHTEKPIALDPAEAKQLVALAKKKKVRLSGAPITFMGEAQQTAWKLVRDGRLGTVRVVYAEMNWNRIEHWHPNPGPFYEVGALFDVGVYPVTVLTTMLGPVVRATGFGKVVCPERVAKDGKPFTIDTPDWICGLLEFERGAVCRLTASFYVGATKQNGIEMHGDLGSLSLSSAQDFAAAVQFRPALGKEWEEVPLVREAYRGTEWARGVTELHDAIRNDRPQRATGAQAAHVVEVCAAVHRAIKTGRTFSIKSRFDAVEPMDWAR